MQFLKNISGSTAADDELVSAYRQSGDAQLVSMLFQRYLDLMYGVCLKYLKDPENARDAVMEIYSILCEKLRHHNVSHFRGWLHVLTRNHCLMKLRTGQKMKFTEADPAGFVQSGENPHPDQEWLEKELQLNRLEDCIGQLAAEQKRSITLFYLEKKCYQEIAAITGQEWNKVRSHIQNGRRNLRQCMEQQNNAQNA